jgi:hypothetical protein
LQPLDAAAAFEREVIALDQPAAAIHPQTTTHVGLTRQRISANLRIMLILLHIDNAVCVVIRAIWRRCYASPAYNEARTMADCRPCAEACA